MRRWSLLLTPLIAFGLYVGCDEDLKETSGSDEISELVETTQLNEPHRRQQVDDGQQADRHLHEP